MKIDRLRTLVYLCLPVCIGLVLVACEDPASVGEDLVGAHGGQPTSEQVSVLDMRDGELLRPGGMGARVLAGVVEDPTFGVLHVEGYFDITAITSADFRAQPVERVELSLSPSYVYGDTTSEVTLALREIVEDWEQVDLPTDTSFSVGPVIQEFTFLATDTLIVVQLPDSWVEDHVDEFRSPELGDLFHGFRLDPVAGNAVVGFGPTETRLIASTADEVISSPIGIAYPSVRRTTPAELPPDRFLMQAGAGPILAFKLDLDADLGPSSVNRAVLSFYADTTIVSQAPAHFVRPALTTLDLYGRTSSGSAVVLGRATPTESGRFVFDSRGLALAIQDHLSDVRRFDRFEVRLPDPPLLPTNAGASLFYYSSLNPVVFFDTTAGDLAPTAHLTITPID